jgi:addiction module HigA family antidote
MGRALRPAATAWLTPPRGVPLRRPIHPGRLLDHLVLAPLAINQSAAARLLGISRRRVNELVQGQRAVSPDTAIRCALAFGIDAGFWLEQQARFDSWQHWQTLRRSIAASAAAARPSPFIDPSEHDEPTPSIPLPRAPQALRRPAPLAA